ncbi:MAG TPA: PEGA domain-containing protein [Methanoregulaceae archaeon]|nr:PEGA domain-containing protein [Methanoregulaceae archaeon]
MLSVALLGGFIAGADPPPSPGNTGYYRLLSNAEGSDVYFGSTYQGQIRNGEIIVPVDLTATPFQTYTLRTPGGSELHGYLAQTPLPGKTILLYADIIPVPVDKTGSLTIIADQPGAMVYINGAFAGTIPASGVLQFPRYQPGNYSIELRLGGYQTYRESSVVSPGSETTLHISLEQSTTGGIDFISFPGGALVYLDGSYIGVTPLHVGNISYGAHEARITLEGYQEWHALLLAKPDITIPVTARLFPLSIGTVTPTPTRTKLGFPVIAMLIAFLVTGFCVSRKKTKEIT